MRAGIEAGGTKFVCAVGSGPDDLVAQTVIPTTTPVETLARVREFFADQETPGRRIEALGVASFGPLDLHPGSATYGWVTTTPKEGWAGTNLVGELRRGFDVPIGLDTDVNGAAYGEYRWGANRGLQTTAYLTVGTGVGGGSVVGGQPLRGLLHPEMGHLTVRRHPDDDFTGSCPYHGDCLEGLASGPAIRARFGRPAQELTDDLERAVEVEAFYLAQLVTSVLYVLSPERIVLAGGVLGLPGLLDAVRHGTLERLAGALDSPAVTADIAGYLVPPGLGSSSGVLGALALAERAQRGRTSSRAGQVRPGRDDRRGG